MKKIIKAILYLSWWLFLLFTILVIYFIITDPDIEPKSSDLIVINDDIEEKQELSLNIKKDIYYIYWQTEHITWLLTIQNFWDWWEQNERDDFFKNTRLEYEKLLSEKKWIDFKIYTKNAIEISWEWDTNNWEKPTSEDESVLIYVYWEDQYALMKTTNEFLNKEWNFLKKYNLCVWLVNWILWPIQAANPQKIDDTHINVYTYMTWKNAYWQKVKENITCMYEYYPKSQSYSIMGIK